VGQEKQMRKELSRAIRSFIERLALPRKFPTLEPEAKARLAAIADLAARCRSPVDRDPQSRDIACPPEPEAPARLARSLARLLVGLRIVGLNDDHAWRLVLKVALDSMPASRRAVFDLLDTAGEQGLTIQDISRRLRLPGQTTARRLIEDLRVLRIVRRIKGTKSYVLASRGRRSLQLGRKHRAPETLPRQAAGCSRNVS